MASGQVGRLSVRVLPDTTKFKEDLRKALTRIEKTARAAVQVRPELDKSSLANVKRQLSDLDATVRVAADLAAGAKERIEDKLDDLDAEATVNADADTGAASAKIAAVSRPRFVPIHLTVAKSSLAKVGAAIATMSGAKNLTRLASNIGDVLSNASSIVPAMARAGTAIGALGSISLVGASNILSVGSSLTAIFPAALALPGIFAGFAAGTGVMIAALKDTSTVLADLGPRFSALQDTISENFWAKAEAPIRRMVDNLLPTLSSGLGEIATQLGGTFTAIADALGSDLGVGQIGRILERTAQSIDIAGDGIGTFTSSLLTLANVGSNYLPVLARWFNDVAYSFEAWLDKAVETGDIFDWIDAGVQGLKDLGRVISGAAGVMGGFARAAKEAGGATLGSLADGLHSLSDTVNSPSFQDGLVGVFLASREAMDNMMPGFESIAAGIESMLPTIEKVLPTIGDIAGTMMDGFGEAMKSPALQGGIEAFFEGVLAAAEALAPVMPVVADVLGRALDAGGKLAETIGDVLGAAVENFGPALGDVLDIAGDLIPVLGDWLVGAIEAVGPVIGDVIGAISDWVAENPELGATIGIVAGAIGGLIAAAAPVVSALLPVIASIVTFVTSAGGVAAIGGAISAAAGAIAAVAGPVALVVGILGAIVGALIYAWNESDTFKQKVGELFQAIKDFAQPILDFITDTVIPVLEQVFESVKQAFETIMDSLVPMIEKVVEIITVIFEKLTPFVEFIMDVLGPVFQFLGDVVSSAFEFIGEVIARVIDTITAILDVFLNILRGDWPAVWESVKGVVSAVWELIKTIIGGAIEFVWNVIKAGLDLIKGIWDAIRTAIGDFVKGVWDAIKGFVQAGIDGAKNLVSNGVEGIKKVWGIVWDWISNKAKAIWDAIKRFVQAGIDGAKDFVSRGVQGIKDTWARIWDTISDKARAIWEAIKRFVQSGIDGAKDKVSAGVDRIKSVWSSAWDTIRDKVKAIWDGIKGAVSGGIDRVKSTVSGGLDRVKSTFSSIWEAIKGVVSTKLSGVVSEVGKLPGKIVSKLSGLKDRMTRIGKDMIQGMINGIKNMASSLVGSAKGVVDDAVQGAKNLLGIHSPSRVFMEIGKYTVEGLEQGLDRNAGLAERASAALARGVTKGYEDGATALSALTAPVPISAGANPSIAANLSSISGSDGTPSSQYATYADIVAALSSWRPMVSIGGREFVGVMRQAERLGAR